MRNSNRNTIKIAGALAGAALFGSLLGPAAAHAEPQGYAEDVFPVGLVYGTFFDEGPNLTLLVGGTVDEFCDSFPDDPGEAPVRVFTRNDGTVDEKVNDKDQPVHLYEQTVGDAFDWIDSVCASQESAPLPIASGTADLKVRTSILSDDLVEVFNSVNGTLTDDAGARYRVRASADFVLEGGAPVGDPADFVSLTVTRTKR